MELGLSPASKKEKIISKNWKWLLLLVGIFSVCASFNMMANPAISLASMTFLFALVFAVQGISEILNYFKAEEKYGWNLVGGIVTLILALALFSGSFIEMVTFVPFIISFWALTNGITKTIVGFKVHKADKSVGTPLVWMGILGIVAGLIMMGHPLMTGFLVSYTVAFIFIYQGVVAIIQFFKI
ncbi:TPA: HdeD family acid-resistance protein [Streptococcus suis]